MEFITQHPVLVVSLGKIAVLLFVVMTVLAYLSWFERKVIAHIQSRWGPYYVGAHGLLQPLADGIKFLFKEDVTPPVADRLVYTLAPFLAFALALTAIALIPFGPPMQLLGQQVFVVSNSEIGLLFLFAITSIGVYGIALAGWSSNSKYALLGGLRSSAQMISYEVSLTLSVVGVLLLAGTLNFNGIIAGQQGYWWHAIPRWHIFPQILGFFCYLTSAIAETNRVPFDLPEAETELVAGFHTEYSSFKFAMFFMAEYANMITVSCLATILFFGGWLSPFPDRWTWQLFLPGAALLATGVYTAFDTVAQMRGFKRLQMTIVTLLALGIGSLCLIPVVAHVIQGPFWFSRQGLPVHVLLRLDSRHVAALPLRPVDVVRLEAAAARFARQSGGDGRMVRVGLDEARMSVPLIVFFVCALLAVAGAVTLILAREPVHSALALIVVMLSLAILYLLLGSDFIAAVQILVYGGAIMVLFVYVIMLLNAGAEERTDFSKLAKFAGVPLGFFLLLWTAHWLAHSPAGRAAGTGGAASQGVSTIDLSLLIFRKYLFPFEATSILILVAILGALVLARKSE